MSVGTETEVAGIILAVDNNMGYSADQVAGNSMLLRDLIEVLQDAAEKYGEDIPVVTRDAGNRYGANFGIISILEDSITPFGGDDEDQDDENEDEL